MVGVTGFTRAEAGSTFLGTAGNYNVYVSGNMNQTGGDVATSVAVGGNVTSSQFTITGTGVTGDSLVVGGTLGYTGAEIQKGNAGVAGTVTMGLNDNSALILGCYPLLWKLDRQYLPSDSAFHDDVREQRWDQLDFLLRRQLHPDHGFHSPRRTVSERDG